MLRKDGFKGIMTKHAFGVTRDNVFVNISIKHTSNHPNQFFLETFEKESNVKNIDSLFDTPVSWDNVKIKLDDYQFYYEIEFDKIVFTAQLISIVVTKKVKAGVTSFDYTLNFRKDVDGDKDSIAAKTYLKYKEENEEGKKVLIEFDVILTTTDAPARTETVRTQDDGLTF